LVARLVGMYMFDQQVDTKNSGEEAEQRE
jgi:hypothetical protein